MLKFKSLQKVTLRDISYLLNIILMFSLLIDPTNVLFGIKNISFVLFCIVSIKYADFKCILIFIIFVMIYFVSLFAGIITNSEFDFLIAKGYLKAFLFLSYLFWVNDNYLRIFRFFYLFSLLIAIGEIIIYFLVLFFPFLTPLLISIFSDGTIDGVSTFAVSNRTFLGFEFLSIYFRTSSVCIISLSVSLFLFFRKKRLKYLLFSIILFLGLFFSGTRANIMSAILSFASIFMVHILYDKKNKLLFVCILILISFFSVFLLLNLLQDSSEVSLNIKAGHFRSLNQLFSENAIRFFFIGTGPASYFYSEGNRSMQAVVELTYLDLIRCYGFVFTLTIIICILLPIYYVLVNKNYDKLLKSSLVIAYLLYLMIAGTNPLLVSSTGFMVICTMFYIGYNNILLEIG